MPYISINNFKFGLDSRRSELSAAPGSLIQALDGHITQGGEFEQRKAFVQYGGATLPATVFGFEATAAGNVVFGSVAGPALPAGIGYIRCQHPTDVNKVMSGVLCSCCFGGVAFCAAQFNAGAETYLFLNGVVVPGSIAGQVLTIAGVVQTAAQIAQQMFNLMLNSVWTNAGVFVENLQGSSFNIYTAYGTAWQPVVSYNSAGSGTLVTALLSASTEPVVGSGGAAPLVLYAGTAGSLATLQDVAGSTTYNILTAAVPFTTNVGTTAAAIATAINLQTNPPLSAQASSSTNTISITTKLALGGNYLKYSVTGAGANLCFENMPLDFSGVANSTSIKNIYVSDGVNLLTGQSYGTGGILTASPSGGLAGTSSFTLSYGTYLWVPGANDISVGAAGNSYTAAANPNGKVFTFDATAPGYVQFTGKGSKPVTAQFVLLTDILANAGINYTGAASLTTIAAAITAHAAVTTNSGTVKFVASNTTVSGAAGTTMYISRASLSLNASAYNNLYFYTAIVGLNPTGFATATPPSQYGFGASTTAVAGRGPTYKVTFGGAWTAGNTYQFDVVTAATTFKAGIGNLTKIVPVACRTLNKRVHLIAGTNWLGCDNDDATQWEEQAPGAFSIDVSTEMPLPQNLVSLATYQGMIALLANNATIIYTLNADPDLISVFQVLENIGSIAALSAQALGELDVIFLHTSGIRSLRARVASLNAYVADIGASVDGFVSGVGGFLAGLTAAQIAKACAIVEPSQNRYWLYIPPVSTGTADVLAARMFVLSYFPSNKIIAWSEYTAAPSSAFDPFIPIKFTVLNGQVYVRGKGVTGTLDSVYVFGGTDNITYDDTPAVIEIPFYDEKKPGHKKYAQAFDSDLQGTWNCYGSADWIGNTLQTIGQFNKATFDLGVVPYQDTGTHFSFKATSVNAAAHPTDVPTVTSIIFYYEIGEQPC